MIKVTAKTKMSPEEAVKKAIEFFGPQGLGMKVKDQQATCASFEGEAGSVSVVACTEGKRTSVDLESREWENQVKEFVSVIA